MNVATKLGFWLGAKTGLHIVPAARLSEMRREIKVLTRSLDRKNKELSLIERLATDFNASWIVEFLPVSRSQFRQDLFVLAVVGAKPREGYFVEFGASNGQDLSNSWLLEHRFGWTGILAEPAAGWHESLVRSRSCAIDFRCVWSRTGETVLFNETTFGELSTVDRFSDSDLHARARARGQKYCVETVSLTDLLKCHNAPRRINYLSVDTEGSEFEILSSFDFNDYEIDVVTVEHNFNLNRDKIRGLLESNGYVRLYEDLSDPDDWYVHYRIMKEKSSKSQ